MFRTKIVLIVALAAALALPLQACGGDDGDDIDTSNAEERMLVAQAYSDISVFCLRAKQKSTRQQLQDNGFIQAVAGVDRLIAQQQENPDITVPLTRQRPEVPFERVYQEVTRALKQDCGKDGRLAAVRLENAAG